MSEHVSMQEGTTRFSVNLDADADRRFERLVRGLADEIGRMPSHRGRRFPSRADLLRAMLAVTDRDPEVRDAVHAQVRVDLGASTDDQPGARPRRTPAS